MDHYLLSKEELVEIYGPGEKLQHSEFLPEPVNELAVNN